MYVHQFAAEAALTSETLDQTCGFVL